MIANCSPTTIRHAEAKDYSALYRLFLAPENVQWTLGLPYALVNPSIERLSSALKQHHILVACVEQEVVGCLELQNCLSLHQYHSAYISTIAVSPPWQRNGIGTQLMNAAIDLADYWLTVSRLDLLVYTDNRSAIGLFEKTGFVIEGTFRDFIFRNCDYASVHIMARLRSRSRCSQNPMIHT